MTSSPHWHGIDLRWAYGQLLPAIRHRTGYHRTAYDVLHDALIRFAISTSQERVKEPHAYLNTIVRNLIIDDHREALRFIPLLYEDGEPITGPDMAPPLVPSAEHLADIQQRLAILQNIIDLLPARCKEVFWLFKIEGLPQQEIADKLGISLNMVQKHIIRAMLDLLEAKDLIR